MSAFKAATAGWRGLRRRSRRSFRTPLLAGFQTLIRPLSTPVDGGRTSESAGGVGQPVEGGEFLAAVAADEERRADHDGEDAAHTARDEERDLVDGEASPPD